MKDDFLKKWVMDKDSKPDYCMLPFQDLMDFWDRLLGKPSTAWASEKTDVIAAIFDLEGFTGFCNQTDPHFVMPGFVQRFRDWLLARLALSHNEKTSAEGIALIVPLPTFGKYLGDGFLFLWDVAPEFHFKIIANLNMIVGRYKSEFLPAYSKEWANAPASLRCGIARGEVISIGNGTDYVGGCINIASRLAKLENLPIVLRQKGLKLKDWPCLGPKLGELVVKKVNLRGIDEELVYIPDTAFDTLSEDSKRRFKEPSDTS